MSNELYKRIVVTYDSMDELLDREEVMSRTLANYLEREDNYEFYDSRIEITNNKYKLILEIKLKDEYYNRAD